MANPFIDNLTAEQQAFVQRKSRGDSRPSYFSVEIAKSQSSEVDNPGNVKISLDLEAVLILAPDDTKRSLLNFLQAALNVSSNTDEDDFALMAEIVAVRKSNYAQIHKDSGEIVSDYDSARSGLMSFIQSSADQGSGTAQSATDVVVPDLGGLFASLSNSYTTLARPDELAVHDRITDAGFLYTVETAATNSAKELLSWANIFQAYLV